MNLLVKPTSKFKSDMKSYKYDNKVQQELHTVLELLKTGQPLPSKYKNHPLHGNYEGEWDCHLKPNVVLIYHIENVERIVLVRIGTHNKLELTEIMNKPLRLHLPE